MPKLKTKKTLTRRIKITKNGKMMHKNSSMGHLKVKRDSSSKSRSGGLSQVDTGHRKLFRRLLLIK